MGRATANFENSGVNAIVREARDKVTSLDSLVFRLGADVRDANFAEIDDGIQAVVNKLYEIKSLMAYAEQRSQMPPSTHMKDGQVVSVPGRLDDGSDTAWYVTKIVNGKRRSELLGVGATRPKRSKK